ncbi:MAG: metallophosphoesterase [Betaproteobacteria bacterium]
MIRALVVVLACALAVAYAWLIEPSQLEVTEHVIDAGPTGDRPIRVVQLSDLHMQSVGNRERAVAGEVARLKPDLVVLSGDVIDRADALGVLDTFLSLLGSVQKVAVLGNWEYWSGVDFAALQSLYEQKHGVRLLINDAAQYRFGDRALQVIGLDDFTAGRPDASLLKNTASGPVSIVVQHSPGWFETPAAQAVERRFPLCLAGHTHGGQIALFGLALWTPRGSGSFTAGRYDSPMRPVYVSRGIGTSILPIRFGARPEIAVFTF